MPPRKRYASAIAATRRLLAGIPQNGDELGSPRAPVTITYFSDLECPICQLLTLGDAFRRLIATDVRTGRVKVAYTAFCTATCNVHSRRVFIDQQAAALAAGRQRRLWDYVVLFFHEQQNEMTDYVNTAFLDSLARQTPGLQYARWSAARTDKALTREVTAQNNSATRLGIDGTPTLIFKGPKGRHEPSVGLPSNAQIEAAIRHVA